MIKKNAQHWHLESNFWDNDIATIKLEMSWRKWDICDIKLYYTKKNQQQLSHTHLTCPWCLAILSLLKA
jgi:hypothetical protein